MKQGCFVYISIGLPISLKAGGVVIYKVIPQKIGIKCPICEVHLEGIYEITRDNRAIYSLGQDSELLLGFLHSIYKTNLVSTHREVKIDYSSFETE